MNKPNIDLADDNFGAVLNCAVHYACGRRTYMPSLVIGFISPLIPHLDNRTLHSLDQDITQARYMGGYGDDCDERYWMKFLDAVRNELTRRGEELYVDWRKTDE